MHPAAHEWAARFATDKKIKVVDIGSRDINGNVRGLFPNAVYTGVDLVDGRGVDVVADAAVWRPAAKVDVVVCLEMLEHCEDWRLVLTNAAGMLKKGGRLVVTAAGPTRTPHSGVDGGPLHADEFYENIDPVELEAALLLAGFDQFEIDEAGPDVRAVCET